MNHELLSLSAELKELEFILSDIPQENVIERMSIESRILSVKKKLSNIEQTKETPQGLK